MTTRIRSSMLPAYPDCPRRSAAKSFRPMITGAGFELRETLPSVGAAAGTAVHAVAEKLLCAKINHETPDLKSATEHAMSGFDEEITDGCEWDDTTPNRDAAQKQISRMATAWWHGIGSQFDPLAVELSLEADAGDNFLLTGHMDLVTVDGWVRDLKTGALVRPYYQQLGAYSLLVRSTATLTQVKGLAIDFVKRCPRTKPQTEAVSTEYPIGPCERAALAVVGRIKSDVGRFRETADPESFSCNPMSMLCSPKYCPAFGTGFCELTKG